MKQLNKIYIVTFVLVTFSLSAFGVTRKLLDDNWQFQLTDDNGKIHAWETVDLPHDWSILSDFLETSPAGNDGGYLPTGKGHYKKILDLNKEDTFGMNSLLLEGVYMNSTLVVNGDTIGKRPYGYSSMLYDISASLKDGENVIEVLVDNSNQKNCRWYSGSGIYRHVWLLSAGKEYIKPWTLYITSRDVLNKSAEVNINASIVNPENTILEVQTVIYYDNKPIKESSETIHSANLNITLNIDNPKLWSPENPNLYLAKISLIKDGNVIDITEESFGIRYFEFSAETGLKLNGQSIVLNGGCVHHDNGIIGARSYDAAERRKVKLLKDAGFNAVRTSHNPPSPAFLDECDKQGLIVIDESFDGWREAKNPYDYAIVFDEEWQNDIASMVLRDRNHPSIFCWSIGNEILERKSPEAVKTAHNLAELCREFDPTRPITSALASWDEDWEIYDPLAAEHDIVGYNYMIHKSESDHQRVPDRVMWQTESYPRNAFRNWEKVNDSPYIIGDFIWTAIDYLGESGIGRYYYEGETEGEHFHRNQWPYHGAYCGDIDIIGNRKPISYYRETLYSDEPNIYIGVREPEGFKGKIKETMWGTYPTWESWTWKGHEGKDIEVEVYTKYPRVALFLNDRLIGEKEVNRDSGYMASFTLPYERGKLMAKAFDETGNLMNEIVLNTANNPVEIRLTADKDILNADNQDLVYLCAELVDENGNIVPDNDQIIDFSVEGEGVLIATGSANLKDTSGYYKPIRKTWNGRSLAVIKSTSKTGEIKIKASSASLPVASKTILSK